MEVSYVLLGLAICAVWLPSVPIRQGSELPPWILLFISAVVAGLAFAVLQPSALLSLGALAALALGSRRIARKGWADSLTALAALVAFALAIHAFPGFRNPQLIAATRLTPDAAVFTQYLNFDKGAAGLLLLTAYVPRCATGSEWRAIASRTFIGMFATAVAVLGAGIITGYVRLEVKFPPISLGFLATNLLFTCVAEEVFFRGLIQERLTLFFEERKSDQLLPGLRLSETGAGFWIPVLASTFLFALAHVAGGPLYLFFTALDGLGCALVYASTRRIESAVLTHFFLNAVHFIGFTYPYLQR